MSARSGIGFDVHPLVDGGPLVLGGVVVPHHQGLSGHSDGDVLVHAIIDSLLGGAGQGDIGSRFPSSDARYEGIASTEMLREVVQLIAAHGWRATYLDATILAERPVLAPFVGQIEKRVAATLGLGGQHVNVKAKTTDGLGFVGRGEGMGALCVATLESA